MDAVEEDVAQALQGDEVQQEGEPQELLADVAKLVSLAELQVVLEPQLLVDWVLIFSFVLVELLNLAHKPELVGVAKTSTDLRLRVVNLDCRCILVLVKLFLFADLRSELLQNLVDAPFE